MSRNDFKPLAINAGANVLSQAAYEEEVSLIGDGFTSGQVRSTHINKIMRQGTVMASAVGAMIVEQGIDALDDGNVPTLKDNLKSAINLVVKSTTASAIQKQSYTAFTDTGVASAYVITPVPAITAYAANQRWQVKIANANTAGNPTPTININGLGARAIVKQSGVHFIGGELAAGTIIDLVDNGTSLVMQGTAGRTRLTTNTTFYVATTGSDTTGFGTSTAPWATIQKAWDFAKQNLDLNGFDVTVNVANGTYTAGLRAFGSLVGVSSSTPLTLNFASTSAIVSTTNSDAIFCALGAQVNLVSGKLQTTTAGSGVNCIGTGSRMSFLGTDFGACALAHISSAGDAILSGSYTISGSAPYHYYIDGGSITAYITGGTVTVSGSLSIPIFANVLNGGRFIKQGSWAYSGGTVTGTRYFASGNSVINCGGSSTFFPGSVAGSTSTGAQYY